MKGSDILPSTVDSSVLATNKNKRVFSVGLKVVLAILLLGVFSYSHQSGSSWTNRALKSCGFRGDSLFSGQNAAAPCAQASPLTPTVNQELWKELHGLYATDGFKGQAIEWLGGAVRVPTESYDKMQPVGTDPRWEAFGPFHDYLLSAFPTVHSTLKLKKVNTYGLLYHWQGSDDSIKPLLLAAHQDVVPVDPKTVDQWQHPPYSGHFDGERIWGRGSSDDKSGLIGIMSSIESLLKKGFTPRRSVVLAFGFDEETSGIHGAQNLAVALKESYGKDSFAMLVDEGGGFGEQYGGVFAVPGIGEKGYLDTRVEVASPGGHSSIPPEHTSIGMLASLLVKLEANPIAPRLERGTPLYSTVQCLGEHAPELPLGLRKSIKASAYSDLALEVVQKAMSKADNAFKAMVGTTQAIDLINGGVKTNALPESAYAVVNHRIATQSSVSAVKDRDTNLLVDLAEQFDLKYEAFGKNINFNVSGQTQSDFYGSLTLSDAFGNSLEPAPITPTDSEAVPYKILSGTIKSTYAALRADLTEEEKTIFIAPGIMTGNTDTRYYWDLTKHIFRYNHHGQLKGEGRLSGVHTVNESITVKGFVEMIHFFTTLILNVDESTEM